MLVVPLLVRPFHHLRRFWWRLFRGRAEGVMVIAVTPEAKLVLVRHTYAAGWHLPGGGKKSIEIPAVAARRELREEIGLHSFKDLVQVVDEMFELGGRQVQLYIFVARDVVFAAEPNLEIAEVQTCNFDDLPTNSQFAVQVIDLVQRRQPALLPDRSRYSRVAIID